MKITPRQFVGIDLECSGAELHEGHRIIQLGLAVGPEGDGKPETFCSLVHLPDDAPWSEEAAQVHGIRRETVADMMQADPAGIVELQARDWLKAQGFTEERSIVAVGFNVAGFDLPFLAEQMPVLRSLFSHRTVDLNAPMFTLSLTSGRGFQGMKSAAKEWARQQIGGAKRDHDAGYDAELALYAFKYIQEHAEEWSVPEKEWRARTAKAS